MGSQGGSLAEMLLRHLFPSLVVVVFFPAPFMEIPPHRTLLLFTSVLFNETLLIHEGSFILGISKNRQGRDICTDRWGFCVSPINHANKHRQALLISMPAYLTSVLFFFSID